MDESNILPAGLFVLSVVLGVIGFFLKKSLTTVEAELKSANSTLLKIQIEFAIVTTKVDAHGGRLERHSTSIAELRDELAKVQRQRNLDHDRDGK